MTRRRSTPARAKAARANGAKGGRPRKSIADLSKMLPPPPDDPLAQPGWYARLMAIDLYETLRGRGNRQRSQDIRAAARAAALTIPKERIYQAELTILGAKKKAKEPPGPETVNVTTEPGTRLRGTPSRGRRRQ